MILRSTEFVLIIDDLSLGGGVFQKYKEGYQRANGTTVQDQALGQSTPAKPRIIHNVHKQPIDWGKKT